MMAVKVSGNARRREIFETFPFFLDKFICVTAAQGWDSSISISIKNKSSLPREGRIEGGEGVTNSPSYGSDTGQYCQHK